MKIDVDFDEFGKSSGLPPDPRRLLLDPSLIGVILGNALSIVLALIFNWDLGDILWIYWAQSITIGLTNFIRILSLKEFTTKGLTSGGRPVLETQKAKRDTAFFFLVHYGFFHLVYAVFLFQRKPLDLLAPDDVAFLLVAIGGFVLSHVFSFIHNKSADFRHKKPNLGLLLFYPYMRVLPMHFIIPTATFLGGGAMTAFMLMKTVADAGMHMVEHALFRRM